MSYPGYHNFNRIQCHTKIKASEVGLFELKINWWHTVVYWPPTQPSRQNRKCTCVNNRCIRSRNIRIWPWMSRGWIECEIVTLAGRRVGVKLLYNPGDRKFKSVGDQVSWRKDAGMRTMSQRGWAPRPPVEQPKRTGKKRCYGHKSGGQYVAVLFSL